MSDEPKKRSRSWIWWAVLAVFLLYPLSTGPTVRFREQNPLSFETMVGIYLPLELATRKCEPLRRALDWYIKLWKD